MKRRESIQTRGSDSHAERVRQSYLNRMKDVAIIGAAIFTLGGCAGGGVNTQSSNSAFSQNGVLESTGRISPTDESVVIGGKRLKIVRLDTSLAELDRQTTQYRYPEKIPAGYEGIYVNAAGVPHDVSFVVNITRIRGTVPIAYLMMAYAPTPSAEHPETEMINMFDFYRYIRTVSNQEMSRVNIVLERGLFDNNGVTTRYTNAYIFPLNASGGAITRQGNGEYIVFSATHHADKVGGSTLLLIEPGNQDSLYPRR
jgi:hypothetical protein